MLDPLNNEIQTEPYPNPFVKIFIFGLGIFWFDKVNDCADLGFVKTSGKPHPLQLLICEENQAPIPYNLNENSIVTINGKSDNQGMGYQFRSNTDPKHDKDFGWMVDLDEIHNPPIDFINSPTFFSRLRLRIKDAIYFTEHKSSTNSSASSGVKPSSPIGQVIGAVTEKDSTELSINGGANLLTNPNGKYTIIIRYHCNKRFGLTYPSDFHLIYDALNTSDVKYLSYDNYEAPWISECEMKRIKNIGKNLNEMNLEKERSSPKTSEKMIEELEDIIHILSCDVACQSATFGKYSRKVDL